MRTPPRGQLLSGVLSRLRCPECLVISLDHNLQDPSVACPNCGANNESRICYPPHAGCKVLNIIQHFFSTAQQFHEDEVARISRLLGECQSRSVTPAAAYKGYLSLRRKYRETTDYQTLVAHGSRFFKCEEPVAMQTISLYMSQDLSSPEVITIPILVVGLVELLLNHLLVNLKMQRAGLPYGNAESEVEKLRSFEDRFDEFQRLTGVTFREAALSISKPFWDRWRYVRKKRNLFVHGNPYAVGWDTAQRAYQLAIDSVGTFTALNNQYLTVGKGSVS